MKKTDFLDSIEVKTPCLKSWEEMKGNDQVRFCEHCAKDVNNLSAMTRKEARKLVARSNGRICVRYIKTPDGNLRTIKKRFHQITRQAGVAAGVVSASLALSAVAYSQGEVRVLTSTEISQGENLNAGSTFGILKGTITDPNGAVIPFALISLTNPDANFFRTANANQEGFFEFKDLPRGTYKLRIDAGGFASREVASVSIYEGSETKENFQLEVQKLSEEVTVGRELSGEGYVNGLVGVIVTTVSRNSLVLAVENNDLDEVKARIAMGEKVNVRDKGYDGNSPLHIAVENGNAEIIEVLLRAGAKTNIKNFAKQTPIMLLDQDSTPEIANMLLRHGAKIKFLDANKNTALHGAVEYASPEVVQLLINAGVNVNAKNKEGRTALMNAVESGNLEAVKTLLGAGADATARDKNNQSAISMTHDNDIKQFLVAYGGID